MSEKKFSQEEVNKIVTGRINREREKLTKDFEDKLRERMTSIQRTLLELCVTQRDTAADMQDSYNPANGRK